MTRRAEKIRRILPAGNVIVALYLKGKNEGGGVEEFGAIAGNLGEAGSCGGVLQLGAAVGKMPTLIG